MKLFVVFLISINLFAQDLKDRVITLMNPPQKREIVYIDYDPFIKGKKIIEKTFSKKVQNNTLYITTILNNRVFINSRWYRVGDTIKGFKIIQISKDSILAKNSKKVVKFGIKRKEKILKVEGK